MAQTTITGMTAVLAANLDDTALLGVDDKNGNTRKATIAQLRTQIAAVAIAFLSTVSMVGLLTASGGITTTMGAFSGVVAIGNTISGVAAAVQNTITSGTTVAYLTSFSQGYTTANTEIAASFRVFAAGTGGLTLLASAGVIRFYAGGASTVGLTLSGGGSPAALFGGSLAITGALTGVTTLAASGAVSIGNAVAAAVGIASTHKVTMVIGGSTYSLLASNI